MVEELADATPCGFDGALGGLAQEGLELGEDLLDRIEVGAVGWQEEEPCACGPDRAAHCLSLVTAEGIVTLLTPGWKKAPRWFSSIDHDCLTPRVDSRSSKRAVRGGGSQMALGVEGVVDGGVG